MISTVAFLAFDALMSAAPVASSDAMMYHFAVPMLEAGKRWEPIFWLPFSFYTGQAHSLIQLGLTLHSEHLANGSIFLAGALSATSLFVLVRRLAMLKTSEITSERILRTLFRNDGRGRQR